MKTYFWKFSRKKIGFFQKSIFKFFGGNFDSLEKYRENIFSRKFSIFFVGNVSSLDGHLSMLPDDRIALKIAQFDPHGKSTRIHYKENKKFYWKRRKLEQLKSWHLIFFGNCFGETQVIIRQIQLFEKPTSAQNPGKGIWGRVKKPWVITSLVRKTNQKRQIDGQTSCHVGQNGQV